MDKGDLKPSNPPASKRRWWVRSFWALSLIAVTLSCALVFLCSNTGMQKVVIPLIAAQSDLAVTADTASISLDGTFNATNITVKVPDKNGKVLIIARFPALSASYVFEQGLLFSADKLDLEMLRWPQHESFQGLSTPSPSSTSLLPRPSISINQTNVILPPITALGNRSPRFKFSGTTIKQKDDSCVIDMAGSANLSDCPASWHWLDRTRLSLHATSSTHDDGPQWEGTLKLSNSFSTAPLPELEALSLISKFHLFTDGTGTIDINLTGKEHQLASLHADSVRKDNGRTIDMNLSGPALNLPTNLADTQMKIASWGSHCSINWQIADTPFSSLGHISIPGVAFSVPGNPDTFLPSLALSGTWQALKPTTGASTWSASADLLKGKTPLFQIISSSSGTTPIELKFPPCSLGELQPYAEPFGLDLPEGEVGGGLKVSFDETGLYRGNLNLEIKKLEIGRGVDRERVNASAVIEGELRPKESLTLDRLNIHGSLAHKDGFPRGIFTIRMLKESPIYFDARDRIDSPGKLILGITAQLKSRDKTKRNDMQIKSRAGLNLTETPQLWVELLGSLRGRTFLQGNVDATMNPDWSLKYLEMSNANIRNISDAHTELFSSLLGIQLNSLSANTVIREDQGKQDRLYRFSSSIRYAGLQGLSWIPEGSGFSQDIKLSGNVDLNKRRLEVRDINIASQLATAKANDAKASVTITSGDPLCLKWSPRFLIEKGQLELNATIPTPFFPNYQAEHPVDQLKFAALLSATTDSNDNHVSALSFSSSFRNNPTLAFYLFGTFDTRGQLKEVDLQQAHLSISKQLAQVISPRCPTIMDMTWNATLNDTLLSLNATSSGIRNVPHLPKGLSADSTLTLKGALTGKRIDISTLDLTCTGKAESGGKTVLLLDAALAKPGALQLNGDWQPAHASLPIGVQIKAAPEFLNRLALFNRQVRDDLSGQLNISLTAQNKHYINDISSIINIGNRQLLDLNCSITQTDNLDITSVNIAKGKLNNHFISNQLLPIRSTVRWKSLSLDGEINKVASHHTFDINATATGLCDSHTVCVLPTDLIISGKGQWEQKSKQVVLDKLNLSGNSQGKYSDTMTFDMAIKDPLRLRFDGAIPRFAGHSPGNLTLKGQLPANWVAESLGTTQGIPKDTINWTSSIRITPHAQGNLADISLRGTSKSALPLELSGKIMHSPRGIPTSGGVSVVMGWTPLFHLFSERFGFEKWEKADLSIDVVKTTPLGTALKVDWSMNGIESFAQLNSTDKIEAKGGLTTWLSSDGALIRIDTMGHAFTSNRYDSHIRFNLTKPFEVAPSLTPAAMTITSQLREDLLLKMSGQMANQKPNRFTGSGTLALQQGSQGFNVSLDQEIRNNTTPLLKLSASADLDTSFSLTQLALTNLSLSTSQQLGRLLPQLNTSTCRTATLSGTLTKNANRYAVQGAFSATDWTHQKWQGTTELDVSGDFKAAGSEEFIFSIDQLTVKGRVRDAVTKQILGNVNGRLKQPGSLTPLADNSWLKTAVTLDGTLTGLPVKLTAPMSPCHLTSTLNLELTPHQISLGIQGRMTDPKGELCTMDATTASSWAMTLNQLSIKDSQLHNRPWVAELLGNSPETWTTLKPTLSWAHNPNTNELMGPFTVEIAGIQASELPFDLRSTVCAKGIGALKKGERPRLMKTGITWTGNDHQSKTLFTINANQVSTSLSLPEDWRSIAPGTMTLTGELSPIFCKTIGTLMQNSPPLLETPLAIKGTMTITDKKYSADVSLFHNDTEIIQLLPEYGAKEKYGNLIVSLKPLPTEVVAAMIPPNYIPTFKNAEIKINARPAKNANWMIYTTATIVECQDRQGYTEIGTLKLATHCELVSQENGNVTTSDVPFRILWNDSPAFTSVLDLTTDFRSTLSVRLKDGNLPLPELFNILNRNTLSPTLACSDGTLSTTGSFTLNQGEWVSNSRLQIKDGYFAAKGDSKRAPVKLAWDVVINSKGSWPGNSELMLTSKGPGWKNSSTLRANWSTRQTLPTSIVLNSDSADISLFWQLFRRNAMHQPDGKSWNLYTLLPSDAFLQSFDADYNVNIANLDCGPIQLEETRLHLVASKGRMALAKCEFEVNNGKVILGGHLQSSSIGSTLSADIICDNVPLKPILGIIYDGENYDTPGGRINLVTSVKGKGVDLAGALGSASGKGSLKVEDFRFYKQKGLKDAAERSEIDDLDYLEFDSILAELTVTDGNLITSGFEMIRDELRVPMTLQLSADGYRKIDDIKYHIQTSHYNKFIARKITRITGVKALSDELSGYKTFTVPATLIKDATGWGVDVIDSSVYQPFKETLFGKWFPSIPKKAPSSPKKTKEK